MDLVGYLDNLKPIVVKRSNFFLKKFGWFEGTPIFALPNTK